jgi:hypothetical protein
MKIADAQNAARMILMVYFYMGLIAGILSAGDAITSLDSLTTILTRPKRNGEDKER